MKKILQSVSVLMVLAFAFSSCDKLLTSPEDLTQTSETIKENVTTEMNVVNVFKSVNDYGFQNGGLKGASLVGDTPIKTWEGLTLTLDYGTTGKIVIEYSDTVQAVGVTVKVTFENYISEGITMNGVVGLGITAISGDAVTFSLESAGDMTIAKEGMNYKFAFDQVLESANSNYRIAGTTTQTMDTVTNYMTLTNIELAQDCEFIKSGQLKLTNSVNSNTTSCDFGTDKDGVEKNECDAWVKISSGILVLNVELK